MLEATNHMVIPPFRNESYIDPSDPGVREKMRSAIEALRSESKEYDLMVGGEPISTEKRILSRNPANPEEIVGRVSSANMGIVDKALNCAYKAFESWSMLPAYERVKPFLRAAEIMRQKRFELDATMILEVG
ncbi:MAG TPA: aldehyde dehydrogenase family protein, partial [Mesotoga infera]|nr:aldehyde dehydrogenase family protein [Mesotoga infera]